MFQDDAIVIPHLGRVYGCVVESRWLQSHNRLRSVWPVPRIPSSDDLDSKSEGFDPNIYSEWEKHDSESSKWEKDSFLDCDKKKEMLGTISVPENIVNCPGSPSLHDLQISQLPKDSFKIISDPVKVFRYFF